MARNTSTAHIIITMDGKQAVNLMNVLQNQAQKTRQELEAMESQGLQGTDDFAKKTAELKSMESAIRANHSAYIDLRKIVANLSGTTLGQLERALKECRKQMKTMTENDPRFRELAAQYKVIDNQIGRMTGQWKQQDGAIKAVIRRLTAYVSVYGGFNLITSKLSQVFKDNLKFSDSLSDIQKTSGLSADSVNMLSDSLMKLDTRSSVEDIHQLAYEAGKLGIGAKYGSAGIEQFVKAADQINVALGEELGGTEAITQLMKMNDVLGLTKKMGVEKSLLATGSAMNQLSQSTTSTAGYMADYTKRLAGIAVQAHLSMAELMALGSASDSTGQEVEVAATAMNKFIVQLQTHYKTVAAAAGISAEGLHNMLEQGRTAEAITTVLRALGEKGGLSQLAPLMKDMGSDGARLTASLATMASNVDLLENALAISRQGFEEATSVTSEYNIKNENAAAIMERMKNSWDKMFSNQSTAGVVKDLAQDFYDLSQSLQTNRLLIWEVKTVIGLLVVAIKSLVALLPYLTIFLSVKGWIMLTQVIRSQLIPSILSLGGVFKGMFTSMATTTAGVNGLARAWKLLSVALKSNVFIAIASVLLTVISSVRMFRREADAAAVSSGNLSKSFKDYTQSSSAASIEVNQLFARLKNTTKGTKEHADAILAINKNYSKYLPFLISEKTSLEDIEKAQSRVNDELRKSIAYKAKNAAMEDVGTQYTNKMADNLSNIQELYSKANLGKVGELDINYITEAAARYREAGKSYTQAVDAVWKDLYYKGGRSFDLVKNGGALSNQWKEVQDSMKGYIANYYNQQVALNNISKKYDPLIGDYTESEEEQRNFVITENPNESKEKKKRREQLRLAKGEYQAVMSAIKVYYKQEQQFINQKYLNKKLTTEQKEQELDNIELRHLRSRIEARKTLHGDDDANWGGDLQKMQSENLSKTDDSMRALQNLLGKNLKEIGDKLRKFGEAEDDGIWSKLEEDKLKLQKHAMDLRKEIEKVLLEYNYTGKVTERFQNELERLKLFFTSYKEGVTDGYKDANEAAAAGMNALRGMSDKLFSIDINNEDGMQMFKNMLSDVEVFGVQMLNMADEDYKALYYKTIEYGDAITEAEKKARDRQLKIAKERYKRTDEYKSQKSTESQDKSILGMYKSAQGVGLATDSMVKDQEVEMYRHRLEAAVQYYNYLASQGKDVEAQRLVMEEAVNDLSEKLIEKTKEKMDRLTEYTGAITEFGTAMGENTFGSLEDRQKVLESFVKSAGESTKKLIMEWVKEQIEHQIIRRKMVEVEEESRDEMANAGKKGDNLETKVEQTAARAALKRAGKLVSDKIKIKKKGEKEIQDVTEQSADAQTAITKIGEEGLANVISSTTNQVVQTKKEAAVENVSTTTKETSVDVQAGIAAGAAKTIGQLGWWGIPLVAVIEGVLGALLGTLMSKASSLFGGSDTGDTKTSTKLVTGMLTYDSGNVQKFAGVIDGQSFPVLGNDGVVYQATKASELQTGIVSNPIATMVNGQPSIIAERGPELVIGRETTSAMMMSRPDLLAAIVNFDKYRSGMTYRTYDRGNLQEAAGGYASQISGATNDAAIGKMEEIITQVLAPVLSDVTAAIQNSNETNAQLSARIANGLRAYIAKNGKGGLIDEVIDGLHFAKKNNTSEKLNRLLK